MGREYNAGDLAHYHEDGGVWRVEVLENISNKKEDRFRLRFLERIVSSRILDIYVKEGMEFEVYKVKGACIPGPLWELASIGDND